MSWITIDEARANLKMWLEAEKMVAVRGQSYRIGTRSLTAANLPYIADRIKFWRNEVERLEIGGASRGPKVYRALPRDL